MASKPTSGPSRVQPKRGDPTSKLRGLILAAAKEHSTIAVYGWSEVVHETAWGAVADVISAEFSQLHQRIAELQARVATLSQSPATATITKFKKHLEDVDNEIAGLKQQQAVLDAAAQEQQAAIAASTDATKSYTAAVLGSKPVQPMRQPELFKAFRVTSHGAKQLPTSTQEALKLAESVLNDINTENKIRAADVSIQRRKHDGLSKGKPQAVIISVLPGDAFTRKPMLWEKHVQDKLHRAGLRVSIHLPQDEYKAKQALWGQFGRQMRAWVTDGKPLIYSNKHQYVTVEGGEVLKLSPSNVAAGNAAA